MNAPISHVLARFADAHPPVAKVERAPTFEVVTLDVADLEARLAAATLEAERACEASRAVERAVLHDDHRDALARAVADARTLRFAQDGATMAGLIDEAFGALRGTIAAEVADALRPLLAEALAERALAAVVEALDRILADADHPSVLVKGPAAFIATIRAGRTSDRSLAFVEDEAVDVTVVAGATTIETRLGVALTALFERSAHG